MAALAALAAITGLCVGCEMYVWFVRLRGGVRVVTVDRTDAHDGKVDVAHGEYPGLPADLGTDGETWVVFSTEYCAVCPTVVSMIEAARPEAAVRVVDVAAEPSLAARYRVRRAPTVLRAEAGGRVVTRTAGADGVRAELHELEVLTAGGVTPAA